MTSAKLYIHGTHTELARLIALNQQVQHLRRSQKYHKRRFQPLSFGQHLSLFQGRGIDFAEVRAYQAGDDLSSIDWRVTARTGKPHTKIFREEKQRSAFIFLDQTLPMYFGSKHCFKSVYAAYLAAALAWIFHHHDDRIGGLVFNDQKSIELKPKLGEKNVLLLMHTINQINQGIDPQYAKADQFNAMLQKLSQLIKTQHLLYIISDFSQFNQDSLQYLEYLAKYNQINLFMINDKLETRLPENAELYFSHPHFSNLQANNRLEKMQVYTTKALNKHYADLWLEWQAHIMQQTKKLGIKMVHLTQEDNLLQILV